MTSSRTELFNACGSAVGALTISLALSACHSTVSAPDSGTGNAWASVLTVLTSSGRPDDHDAAPDGAARCAREDSNPRRPAPEAGALSAELRALVLLNVEQTGRETSRCPRRESNPRLRFRRAASCPLDHEGMLFTTGARQMRAVGDGPEWQHDKCTLLGRIHAQEKGRPGDVPGRPVVRRCGQTTGPPESPARNEDTLRYATGGTTRGCSQGSTGRRRSCWTSSRTVLLLSVMSGGPRTGMPSTEEDRTPLSRSTQPHFLNSSGIL